MEDKPGEYVFVFPTSVGVNLAADLSIAVRDCFPHKRGGEPTGGSARARMRQFSPQAWG